MRLSNTTLNPTRHVGASRLVARRLALRYLAEVCDNLMRSI